MRTSVFCDLMRIQDLKRPGIVLAFRRMEKKAKMRRMKVKKSFTLIQVTRQSIESLLISISHLFRFQNVALDESLVRRFVEMEDVTAIQIRES